MAVESKFTPHARGSTFPLVVILNPFVVYPACAGIDPLIGCGGSTKTSLPRMRGDRPFAEWMAKGKAEFTPHARGSTAETLARELVDMVYPACAGIDRTCRGCIRSLSCLPRMRGDRPVVFTILNQLV